jgi:hypothetical protein
MYSSQLQQRTTSFNVGMRTRLQRSRTLAGLDAVAIASGEMSTSRVNFAGKWLPRGLNLGTCQSASKREITKIARYVDGSILHLVNTGGGGVACHYLSFRDSRNGSQDPGSWLLPQRLRLCTSIVATKSLIAIPIKQMPGSMLETPTRRPRGAVVL